MSLRDRLVARIRAAGPITLAEYMRDCLTDPDFGYYVTRDPLGRGGDFVTAPEISQMFGELIGLALAQSWLDQGAPAPFTLAEPGPGRGTLMADILRATRRVPGFPDAARLHLVEVSPALRSSQAQTLSEHAPTWVDSLSALPDGPLWLVANEFFDALPVRQFVRGHTGWSERLVAETDGELVQGFGAEVAQPALAGRLEDTKPGDVVELCPEAPTLMAEIATRIARHGGAALVIDYGGWRSLGDTVQAVRAHKRADILADPGSADLTAHVDFEALARAARAAGAAVTRMTPQGVFLERLGITDRARMLAQVDPKVAAAHRRLTHPEEMGNLFKVMGIHPPEASPVPGLAT